MASSQSVKIFKVFKTKVENPYKFARELSNGDLIGKSYESQKDGLTLSEIETYIKANHVDSIEDEDTLYLLTMEEQFKRINILIDLKNTADDSPIEILQNEFFEKYKSTIDNWISTGGDSMLNLFETAPEAWLNVKAPPVGGISLTPREYAIDLLGGSNKQSDDKLYFDSELERDAFNVAESKYNGGDQSNGYYSTGYDAQGYYIDLSSNEENTSFWNRFKNWITQ